MTMKLHNSIFVHNPRCGGLSLKKFFSENDLCVEELTGDVDSHATIATAPANWFNDVPYTFTTIRHPWDWICSRWSHAYEHNVIEEKRHHGIHRELDELLCESFQETIKTLLRLPEPIIYRTFLEATKNCDGVFPLERIKSSTFYLLSEIEYRKDAKDIIQDFPAINTSRNLQQWRDRFIVSISLQEEFLYHERKALRLWLESVTEDVKRCQKFSISTAIQTIH